MKPIDLYAYYRALYRYFRMDEPLEFRAVNRETFASNPELAKWEKLARKRECKNYVLSNILAGNFLIKEFNDPTYFEWCRVNENLFYNFKSDIERIFETGLTTNLLKLRLDYKVSRETIAIMLLLSDRIDLEESWVKSKDNLIREEGKLISKYKPLVALKISSLEKYQNAVKTVAEINK